VKKNYNPLKDHRLIFIMVIDADKAGQAED